MTNDQAYNLLCGDINKAIAGFTPLAKQLVNHYASRSPMDRDDLLSTAMMSIVIAHDTYKKSYDYYALKWVRNKINSDLSGMVAKDLDKRRALEEEGIRVVSADMENDDGSTLLDTMESSEPDPLAHTLQEEAQGRVKDALADAMATLKPAERKAMVAMYLTPTPNLQRKQVARSLGCSIYVLNKHINNARKKLKHHFGGTNMRDIIDDPRFA